MAVQGDHIAIRSQKNTSNTAIKFFVEKYLQLSSLIGDIYSRRFSVYL
jgi:hypothetical protein